MNKKLVTSLIAISVIGTSVFSFSIPIKADALKSNDNQIIRPLANYYAKVIATSGANLRSGAGTNYSIVATASYGEVLQLLQESMTDSYGDNWFKVKKSNGAIGWVRADLVEVY